MERDEWIEVIGMAEWNFNSHAHVERDSVASGDYHDMDISTHTLTWSVTGATVEFTIQILNFNSHAHVERDGLTDVNGNKIFISTHTLTWSVTCPHS